MNIAKKAAKVPGEAIELLNSTDDPAILLDRSYNILAANQAYRSEMKVDKDLAGLHCYQISHGFDRPCDQAGECCPLKVSVESGHRERMLHIHLSEHGREFVDVEIQPVRNGNDQPEYFLEVLRPTLIASAEPSPSGLVGTSKAFNEMLELVQRVAVETTPVMLTGESGTGKELIARAIHEGSNRAKMPFVPVECSGLTESLFESELFGHKKGAFTGAHYDKHGLVESAHKGTLFLDEIGEMSPQLQVKLLRLLETQTFRRVGEVEAKYVDFRLICATNKHLPEMVEEGTFRTDLFYRVSAFPIELPPLRDRREDIALLAASLLERSADKRKLQLSDAALECLRGYSFPGNIRELQNMLERARILATGEMLLPEHFPAIKNAATDGLADQSTFMASGSDSFAVDGLVPLDQVEQEYLQYILKTYAGKRDDLARNLGVSLRTLTRKLQRLKKHSA
jgi:transcriptional regulator with PAS, ATPase and Fis domain